MKIIDSPVETESSCELIEAAGHALKNSGSDDAYLSPRWGDLIIDLSNRERQLLHERGSHQDLQVRSSSAQNVNEDLDRMPAIPNTAITTPDDEFLSLYDPQTWVSFPLGMDFEVAALEPSLFGQDFSWGSLA